VAGTNGRSLSEAGQQERIVSSLTDAVRLAPGSIFQEELSAWTFQSRRDWSKAEVAWNQCLSRDPKNGFARISKACMYEQMNRHKEAAHELSIVKQDKQDLRPYALQSLWYANRGKFRRP